MNTLEIKNLCKTYPNGVKALDGISLTLTNGMFGLLGPNGAGKSSLMRTLATLQNSDEGKILFSGIDIQQKPFALRKQLGYLPQEFGVYNGISAERLLDHLAILKGIEDHKKRKEQVKSLLGLTNLYQHKNKAVSSFSGGMRQRFGIAQALLGNPQLVIVDEPTAGLDPEEQNRFHNLLSEIGENVIVILSTHIVEDVQDLCPKMAIMANGNLLLEGEPRKLIQQLEGKVWKKTIQKNELETFQKLFDVISTRLFAGETQIIVHSEEKPNDSFIPVVPSLEEVYFSELNKRKAVLD